MGVRTAFFERIALFHFLISQETKWISDNNVATGLFY